MNQCPLLVAWAVLVLIKSHSNRHSEFWLLNWLILQTMGTRNCTLRLPPAVSPWTFFHTWSLTGTCSWHGCLQLRYVLPYTGLFSYTTSYSKMSTIKYLAWRGSIFIGWGYSFEWRVFVFLLHSNSIMFTDEWLVDLVMSFNCLSVTSADRTTSIAFSRARSEILSNLSLVRSVIDTKHNSVFDKRVFQGDEFTCFTYLPQHGNILINNFITFLGSRKELVSPVINVFPRLTVFLKFL